MRSLRYFRSSWVAVFIATTMASPNVAALVSGGAESSSQSTLALPAQAPARASTPAATTAPDGGWPRIYAVGGGGNAILYQPQVATWTDQKKMVAWSAVAYEQKDAKQPAYGTIKIEADTKVAVDDRLVDFSNFSITEFTFTSLSRDQSRDLVAGLQKAIPDAERVIALDRVMAAVDKSTIRPKETPGIKADPPKVFYSPKSAILMNLDGDPIWSPIQDNDLKFAVNTNWDLFVNTPEMALYLRNDDTWLKAFDIKGPWAAAGKLPASFGKLPADENWKDVKASVPGKPVAASDAPSVFVSTEPAELLLLRGAPVYEPVAGTSLLWVSNTDSDLFRMGKTGAFYFLVAGRWFSTEDLNGPWTFATPKLPEDFKKIPLEHARSRVLASVPGTDQAAEAGPAGRNPAHCASGH